MIYLVLLYSKGAFLKAITLNYVAAEVVCLEPFGRCVFRFTTRPVPLMNGIEWLAAEQASGPRLTCKDGRLEPVYEMLQPDMSEETADAPKRIR